MRACAGRDVGVAQDAGLIGEGEEFAEVGDGAGGSPRRATMRKCDWKPLRKARKTTPVL